MTRAGWNLTLAAVAAAVLAACSPPASPSVSPSEPPAASASLSIPQSASAAASASASVTTGGGVIVTFLVADAEEYRILLTEPADIAIAEALLAGEEAPPIPNGVIVRGDDGGVNTGWSWHIDPDTVEFADFSIEACDGRPSYVEDGTLTNERFCPWSAEVVAIEPAG